MSSRENSQNNFYNNQTWDHSFTEEDNEHRRPNQATESRVLSRFLKNDALNSQTRREESNLSQSGSQPSQEVSSLKSQQPLTLPEVHNQLSADAKVFVPRSRPTIVSNPYQSQDYTQDDPYRLSVEAAEFVPRVSEEYNNYSGSFYTDVPYGDYDQDSVYLDEEFSSMNLQDEFDPLYNYQVPSGSTDNPILHRFNQVLHILNIHPGNMEEYLRPICEMIRNSSETTEIVNDIVESLFNQSIQEANFRYTGARICQFLNNNLKDSPHFSGFNKIFIKRCQKEYGRCQELKNGNQQDQERLRGLAMFMAEIYLNVETEIQDGTIQRLHFLPGILVDIVNCLLSSPSDQDVKCSCQLLKLSGGLIEDVMKTKPEDCKKFDEIFAQLQNLQSYSKLTENTKFMIGSVIKLKENNWNRSSSSPTKKSVSLFPLEPNNFQASEPVFYNQKGAPCSRTEAGFPDEDSSEDGAYVLNEEEEAAFLTWQAEQEGLTEDSAILRVNDSGYDSYQIDEVADEGGMGDEMEAAYEEFLQKQNFLPGFQNHLVGPPPTQMQMPSVPHIFNHPPPNMPPHQVFNGYQQQHMLPLNQNQMPQQQQGQQRQQQPYQNQYANSDRFNFHRQ